MTITEFDTAILPIGSKLAFGDALFVVFYSFEDYQSQTIQKEIGVEHALGIIAHLAKEFNLSVADITEMLILNGGGLN